MKTATLSVVFVLASLNLSAQSAVDLIRRSEELMKGKSCRGTFTMTVTTPDFTRTMSMESWWVGNDKALIIIRAPKKEAGNKTLKIKNEMWLYLKNTETTIKLPPSMMLQSWNGSDFTNDDLVRESSLADDYMHTLLGEESLDGVACWKIESIPKPDAPVVWGKLTYWVRKSDGVGARVNYFDERGKLVRSMLFSDFKRIGGRTIPVQWTMVNHAKPGNATSFRMDDVAFDIAISDRIFSFRELESRRER